MDDLESKTINLFHVSGKTSSLLKEISNSSKDILVLKVIQKGLSTTKDRKNVWNEFDLK